MISSLLINDDYTGFTAGLLKKGICVLTLVLIQEIEQVPG